MTDNALQLVRFIFLESIAGVPGMVAGMLRHLHSLRRLKRDNGWIETLLEESYNERMVSRGYIMPARKRRGNSLLTLPCSTS